MIKTIRIGTRRSVLARIQTDQAAEAIQRKLPEVNMEIVPILTQADERLNRDLGSFGGKGAFTKELEEALLCGRIDLAVHSAKDLPVQIPSGLCVGAVLKRAGIREVLVQPQAAAGARAGALFSGRDAMTFGSAKGQQMGAADSVLKESARGRESRIKNGGARVLQELPPGSVIGTGSLRRELQVKQINPEVTVKSVRGNIQTRLRKLLTGDYDALILAEAGLQRLFAGSLDGFDYEAYAYFAMEPEEMLPAPAQGILALESRQGEFQGLLADINDADTWAAFTAERTFLREMNGGCNAPAAAWARRLTQDAQTDLLVMDVRYAADGRHLEHRQMSRPVEEAGALGRALAKCFRAESEPAKRPQTDPELVKRSQTDPELEKRSQTVPELTKRIRNGPEPSDRPSDPETAGRKTGRVWLIGAGPGDASLISQKGLRYLRQADVIVYDHLIPVSLLNEASDHAKLIFVGKEAGVPHISQEEINQRLIAYAAAGANVARLKGGDVFIFGRGSEEGQALARAGIPFEVIPGISSVNAVPAYQGIPLTHRGIASSFHVITGHEDPGKGPSVLDYEVLAKEEGTLVFLMGLLNLPVICQRLMEAGKSPATPAAVLSNGTTARQRIVTGSIKDISEIASEAGIRPPALIVIGEVVSFHEILDWYGKQPLAGKRVLVTAAKPTALRLSDALRALGAEPEEISLIRTRPLRHESVDRAYTELKTFTWVVFTSRNGVRIFFEGLKNRQIDLRRLSHLNFAVIGSGTAEALKSYGICEMYMPQHFTSAQLAAEWVPMLAASDKVLLARARGSSAILEEALQRQGIAYLSAWLYESVPDFRRRESLLRTLADVDYVACCSASAVRAFHELTEPAAVEGPEGVQDAAAPGRARNVPCEQTSSWKLVCIGPVTAAEAAKLGMRTDLIAGTYNIEGMVQAIWEDVSCEQSST